MILATQDERLIHYNATGERDRWLDIARGMGTRCIRLNVYSTFDYKDGAYDNLDETVRAIYAKGMTAYITITGTPRWTDVTQSGPVRHLDPDPDLFADLCYRVVKRYSAMGVIRYGIWNEPNHDGFLRVSKGETYDYYAKLWRAGSEAAWDANTRAKLLYGELAARGSMFHWLKKSTRKGFHAHGFAWHPYQFSTPPHKRDKRIYKGGIGSIKKLERVLTELWMRSKLRNPVGGTLPIFITEFGYYPKPWPHKYALDEATRAEWAAQAYLIAEARRVKMFLWYQLGWSPEGTAWNTGIVNPDGTPNRTYCALADLSG